MSLEVCTAHWDRENLAWLAGLMEGEGWFRVAKCKRKGGFEYSYLAIGVAMTDEDVVRRAAQVWGFGKIYSRPSRLRVKDGKFGKPQWSLQSSNGGAIYALCVALYPFLGSRRQARIREMVEVFKTFVGSGNRGKRVRT